MQDKQPNIRRKSEKEADGTILSDSDSSLPDLECETCGISFSDVKNYRNHLQGKKHQNKVKEAKYKAKNQVAACNKNGGGDESEDDEECDEIHCEVCNRNFTGFISYAAHVKGTLHSKNVKKQKLKEQLGDMPGVLENNKDENDSDSDDVLQKPYARCATCQKEFSGPESFRMHMKSATHLKKTKQSAALQKLKNSDDDNDCEKCDVCQKAFSGVIPYQIHMKSNIHKKNLEKIKVAEEIKEHCANDDFKDGYACKECKKTFNDPLAFKNHLKNNSHEKQKAKDVLVQFLKDHPEIVFVTPFDKDSEKESDGEESDPQYYLICKLCHVSFSGPESAQDHVKSKKHISTKKEKKNLQRMKEQKKNSSENFNNTDLTGKDGKSSEEKIADKSQVKSSENGDTHNSGDFELI